MSQQDELPLGDQPAPAAKTDAGPDCAVSPGSVAWKRKLTPEEAAELRSAMMSGWTLEKATPEELTRARSQVQWMARCLYRDTADITPEAATREAAKMIHETWTMLGPQGWRPQDIAYWHKGTAWTRRGTPEDDALWENAPSEDGEPQNGSDQPTARG